MKTKLLLIALAVAGVSTAQNVSVVSKTQLLSGVESECYNPVISADGSKILFTGEAYNGLKMYDVVDNVTTTISNKEMAGFFPVFSSDNNKVYFLSQVRKDMRVYRAMNEYTIGKAERQITDYTRGMTSPVAMSNGVCVVTEKGRSLKGAQSNLYVYSDKAELVVVKNGVERRLSPVQTPYTYLWTSLSPDKTKILFYAGGKGAYVCDLNGNVLANLGVCESPAWCGNGHVVFSKSTHDGHQYESAKLVVKSLDGKVTADLTRPESMSMTPSATADGKKVVYSTIDGRMFLIELNIK